VGFFVLAVFVLLYLYMKERVLRFIRSHKKVTVIAIASFLLLTSSALGYYLHFRNNQVGADTNAPAEKNYLPGIKDTGDSSSSDSKGKSNAKSAIKQNPPKTGGGGLSSSTRTNPDGSQTTSVIIGGSGDTETPGPCGGSSPQNICFVDETGQNGALESILKNYLATLRYSNELSSLYEVAIVNAGASGWTGYWAGGYTMAPSGDITSAYGYIVLNTYYYQGSPYYNDYMKLTFSHEYGHHYTLYHKWVDMNLPIGVRLPDEYYNIRPLSKANTATDYSLGWSNCELEIIAEDYSYFYSGYGYHAMAGSRGYPSGATLTWINNMASFSDNPPIVSITAPVNGATIAGIVTFSASAGDDLGVTKVSFYINDVLLFEDVGAPYETSLNTSDYVNGSYTLKAVAYDMSHNTPATISVNISN